MTWAADCGAFLSTSARKPDVSSLFQWRSLGICCNKVTMDLTIIPKLLEHNIIFIQHAEIIQKLSWKWSIWRLLHLIEIHRLQQRYIMLCLETGHILILKLDKSLASLAYECWALSMRHEPGAFSVPKDIPFDGWILFIFNCWLLNIHFSYFINGLRRHIHYICSIAQLFNTLLIYSRRYYFHFVGNWWESALIGLKFIFESDKPAIILAFWTVSTLLGTSFGYLTRLRTILFFSNGASHSHEGRFTQLR